MYLHYFVQHADSDVVHVASPLTIAGDSQVRHVIDKYAHPMKFNSISSVLQIMGDSLRQNNGLQEGNITGLQCSAGRVEGLF